MLQRGAVFGCFLLVACGSSPTPPPPAGTDIDPAVSGPLSAALASQAASLSGLQAVAAQGASVALQAGVQATAITLPASFLSPPPSSPRGAAASSRSSGTFAGASAFAFGVQITLLHVPVGASTQVYSGAVLFKDKDNAALGIGTGGVIPPSAGLILEGGSQLWVATAGQESATIGATVKGCLVTGLPAYVTACSTAPFTNAGFAITASVPFAGMASGSNTTPPMPSTTLVGMAFTIDCSLTSLCGLLSSVVVGVTPSPETVQVGATQQFTATVLGTSNSNVTWSLDEGSVGGSVSAAGLYTAPGTAGTFHVRATSAADSTASGVATVTASTGSVIAVSISPSPASVQTGGMQLFTATVTGSSTNTVTWSASGGTLSTAGPSTTTTYTAPGTPGGYQIRATTVATPPVTAVATVTVSATGTCINEFSVPTAGSGLFGIAAGPDGALWFTETQGNKIGRITTAGVLSEYALTAGSYPVGITAGPDGALWFIENGTNKVGRITTSGTITNEFPITTAASDTYMIALGPDNNLWFAEGSGYANNIGRITPAGAITEFPVTTASAVPTGITSGSDGALWFTEYNVGKIGRITTTGVVSEFPVITATSGPFFGITTGSDHNLWFVEGDGNRIGSITTSGTVTEYFIPLPVGVTASSQPDFITSATDGNLWFTESAGNNIGRITTAGTITQFPIPTAGSYPYGIANGSDGALWFVEYTGNQIGRVAVAACP
jgi:streptogramin lyase